MKPDNALVLPVPCDMFEVSVEDALCLIGFNPLSMGYLLELRHGGEFNSFQANKIAAGLIKTFDNTAINVAYDASYDRDEWLITDIQSGRCVHSYGA